MWMQISAGQGPAECAWVVAQLSRHLQRDAERRGLTCQILASEAGERKQTFKSILLKVEGANQESGEGASQDSGLRSFVRDWCGSHLWIGQSPFRPHHKRKNWFVAVEAFDEVDEATLNLNEIRIESMRGSGPGGQHANKTESAVRITHLPSGATAIAREERSQHLNRKLALARLRQILDAQRAQKQAEGAQSRWQAHHSLERGNAKKVFKGPRFTP